MPLHLSAMLCMLQPGKETRKANRPRGQLRQLVQVLCGAAPSSPPAHQALPVLLPFVHTGSPEHPHNGASEHLLQKCHQNPLAQNHLSESLFYVPGAPSQSLYHTASTFCFTQHFCPVPGTLSTAETGTCWRPQQRCEGSSPLL